MGNLAFFDYLILALYGIILLGMGFYFARKMKTAGQFMTANGKIPGWAAGLAVMSAYTSSISYIATPGKAFDSDWHPIIFALCMIPVSWIAVVKIIPLYRKLNLISVYTFLEERLGSWARLYDAFSFLLFILMTGDSLRISRRHSCTSSFGITFSCCRNGFCVMIVFNEKRFPRSDSLRSQFGFLHSHERNPRDV